MSATPTDRERDLAAKVTRGTISAERAKLMLREPGRVARYAEMTDISPAEAWKRVREAAGVAP